MTDCIDVYATTHICIGSIHTLAPLRWSIAWMLFLCCLLLFIVLARHYFMRFHYEMKVSSVAVLFEHWKYRWIHEFIMKHWKMYNQSIAQHSTDILISFQYAFLADAVERPGKTFRRIATGNVQMLADKKRGFCVVAEYRQRICMFIQELCPMGRSGKYHEQKNRKIVFQPAHQQQTKKQTLGPKRQGIEILWIHNGSKGDLCLGYTVTVQRSWQKIMYLDSLSSSFFMRCKLGSSQIPYTQPIRFQRSFALRIFNVKSTFRLYRPMTPVLPLYCCCCCCYF